VSARVLVHVCAIAFGVFAAALNAAGPGVATTYLVAGAVTGPSLGRFLRDRRKLRDGYYGSGQRRRASPGWCPPCEATVSTDPRVAKLRRLANDYRSPVAERDAALQALNRLLKREHHG
jgi:hypothetical protein